MVKNTALTQKAAKSKGQMMQQGNKQYYISAQTGEMAVSRFIFETTTGIMRMLLVASFKVPK